VYEQINALTQQVEEKEAELNRERESARSLSEKLHDLQATSSGFEGLVVQGKEILRKLGEQHAKAEEHRNQAAEELQERLVLLKSNKELITDAALVGLMLSPSTSRRFPTQCPGNQTPFAVFGRLRMNH
jgi:chromosome segregation ATPase